MVRLYMATIVKSLCTGESIPSFSPFCSTENGAKDTAEAEEERTQERLAKRFAKRARMCRLEETYADSQEFSQQKLIDEDGTMKQELKQMKVSLQNLPPCS